MATFIVFVVFVLYFGWGIFLIIVDFSGKTCRAPMYVVNFRENNGRIFSCVIALIKLFLWPLVYVLKYI